VIIALGIDSGRITAKGEGSVLTKKLEPIGAPFAVISLWGKFGGLYACGATFPYTVPLPNIFVTHLFSRQTLKRKDFPEIVRLTWAQEAPGSNPGAPTKTARVFSLVYQNPSSPPTSLWNSPRQEVWMRKSFNVRDFATR